MHIAKSFLIGYRYHGTDTLIMVTRSEVTTLADAVSEHLRAEGLTAAAAASKIAECLCDLVVNHGGCLHDPLSLHAAMASVAWLLMQSTNRDAVRSGRFPVCGMHIVHHQLPDAYSIHFFSEGKADA